METAYALQNPWWEGRREPVNLAMQIPITDESQTPKPPKVRRSCMLGFVAIVLRILGLVVAVVTLAYGAWAFFQIPQNLDSIQNLIAAGATGAFCAFIGGLSLLAELRNRWTMRGCLSTYILFASYLGRGLVYVAFGGIMFALKYYNPPVVKQEWIAAGILAVGVLNLIYYPFYWKQERKIEISKAHKVPLEPYPEEIIYGMDTLYIKNHLQREVSPMASPASDSSKNSAEGANEPTKYKDMFDETPGKPLEKIDIVIEPKLKGCAEEEMDENNISIHRNAIGVGAS